MKKFLTLAFITTLNAQHALAAGCEDRTALNNATTVSKTVTSKMITLKGVTMVGVSECSYYYFPDILKQPHAAVAKPDQCGVKVFFESKADEEAFAAIASVFGKYHVDLVVGGAVTAVPICGETSGKIEPY